MREENTFWLCRIEQKRDITFLINVDINWVEYKFDDLYRGLIIGLPIWTEVYNQATVSTNLFRKLSGHLYGITSVAL